VKEREIYREVYVVERVRYGREICGFGWVELGLVMKGVTESDHLYQKLLYRAFIFYFLQKLLKINSLF